MKKTTIIKGSAIVGIIALIISISANFYTPYDCNIKMAATINLNDTTNAQPIFLDKHYGVTYMLMGKFDIDITKREIKTIDFLVNKLSGLANVKVDNVKFRKKIIDDSDTLDVYLSYGICKNNYLKTLNMKYDPDKPMNFVLNIKYKNLFSSGNQESDYYEDLIYCDYEFNGMISQSRGGRICDLNCIHE